ncbi:MAG TPA: tetratricopeptide repeat protein, partial [Candidatus Polarisedimenticolia bacterium]|nr:tetratricopeptide repeat protein [Candidatus Polarisedimenticolia bacterium]
QTTPATPRPTPVIQTPQAAQRPAPVIQAPRAAMEPAFDYSQEDLGLERTPGPTGNLPAAPPPSSRPVAPRAGLAPEGEDALQTNTLAELYLRQGLVDRAVEVYRAMLRVDPENDRARLRLQDLTLSAPRSLEGPANGPMRRPGVPEPAAPAARAVEATPARAARPATVSPDPQPAESPERVVRLERWLRSIRSGSADPGEIRR